MSFAIVPFTPITVAVRRAKASIFTRPSILFRPHVVDWFQSLVEPPGTAPGSGPFIPCAFIAIVPRRNMVRIPRLPFWRKGKTHGSRAHAFLVHARCSRTVDMFGELHFDPNTEADAPFRRVGLLETNAKSLKSRPFPSRCWSTITSGRYSLCLTKALRVARILLFAAVRSRHLPKP